MLFSILSERNFPVDRFGAVLEVIQFITSSKFPVTCNPLLMLASTMNPPFFLYWFYLFIKTLKFY